MAFDKSVIRAGGKKKLDDEVVDKIKEYSHFGAVRVTGYTDRLGTDNDNFGTLFTDADHVAKRIRIRDHIAPKVAADKAYRTPTRAPRTPRAWPTTWRLAR